MITTVRVMQLSHLEMPNGTLQFAHVKELAVSSSVAFVSQRGQVALNIDGPVDTRVGADGGGPAGGAGSHSVPLQSH